MRKTLLALSIAIGCALVAGAFAAGERAARTLRFKATLALKGDVVDCPSGTPQGIDCFHFVGRAAVPGLGQVTAMYTRSFDGNYADPCVRTLPTMVIRVAGKGEIEAAVTGPECVGVPPVKFSWGSTIDGGSGAYAGASGAMEITSRVPTGLGGVDTWTGTLTVPGLAFDLTPPALTGAVPKTAVAPKNAKRVRVRYKVTAQDAVDGSVPAACTPLSGGYFTVGRTRVSCSATDSSANRGTAQFVITVKRS